MTSLNRRLFSLAGLAGLAACSTSQSQRPQFKTYSGPPVTQVVVYKGRRRMHLLSGTTVLKSYDFGLGFQPAGHKQFEGGRQNARGHVFR